WLGQIAALHDRAMPSDEVQPAAAASDLARQDPDRQGGERYGDFARRRSARLQGLRQGRGQEVRHRSAPHGESSLVICMIVRFPSWSPRPGGVLFFGVGLIRGYWRK